MRPVISKYLNYKYPRSFILRKPFAGGLIVALFCFSFTLLYHPLDTHPGKYTGYFITMAIYSLFSGMATVISAMVLNSLKWSDEEHWTLKKEILSISLIMAVIGIVIYLMGFILQDPSQRWNIATLINSFFYAILLSIIPFAFFTLSNYRYLFTEEYYHTLKTTVSSSMHVQEKNEIHISSQLKKESLSFLPDELIYAESDGNYVVFHLSRNNMVMKEMIRNSINNIEQQLASIPYYLRTHRAFIVNLKKVTGRNGTTLGYTLRLEGTEAKVPVSRTNTTKFNSIFASYKD